MITRRQARLKTQENTALVPTKRKAVESPADAEKVSRKRSAFGDLTNALRNVQIGSSKKCAVSSFFHKRQPASTSMVYDSNFTGGRAQEPPHVDGIATIFKATLKNSQPFTEEISKSSRSLGAIPEFSSIEFCCNGEISASLPDSQDASSELDEALLLSYANGSLEITEAMGKSTSSLNILKLKDLEQQNFGFSKIPANKIDPVPGYDFDKENDLDPFSVPQFAMEIFKYYTAREKDFKIGDYMARQTSITKNMRAILVDWMVEIQENFELNHETLYQAVKMTDLYLDRKIVDKRSLQLVGTTALFISSKFDERCPPACEDFLYICDDAYSRKQLFDMEREIFKTLRFTIAYPLSYRFLRRFAKTSKVCMETLTLARYILESSLMHYEYVQVDESLLAAACLLLAIRMKNEGDWTEIHEKYTQYALSDIDPLSWHLNSKMKAFDQASQTLVNIRNKYSHELFYQVTKIPFLDDSEVPTQPPQFLLSSKPAF